MIIKEIQLRQMEAIAFQAFIKKTTELMISEFPDWKIFETFSVKESHVMAIVAYGQKWNITSSLNLFKLVRYTLLYNKDIFLAPEFDIALKQVNVDEDMRLEDFYLKLAGSRNHLKLMEI